MVASRQRRPARRLLLGTDDDLAIRPAKPAEIAALAVLVAAFRDHLKATAPSDDEIRERLPALLAEPGLEFACAWRGAEPVGYTQTRFLPSLWVAGSEAFLEDLFVLAPARGRTVGRRLLRHAIARAEARGARRFSLTTNEKNEAAQSLYRSEGWSRQSHALYPGGREVLWVKALGRKG